MGVLYMYIYPKLPISSVMHLPLFTRFLEKLYNPIIVHLWIDSTTYDYECNTDSCGPV